MNSLILLTLLCTGAYASTMPVFNLDWLNFCPLVKCSFMRCPDGLVKKSIITLPNGKQCPGCQNTCVGNPMIFKRSLIFPFSLCPMVSCAMPMCDRDLWVTTTISINGKSCAGCPACSAV